MQTVRAIRCPAFDETVAEEAEGADPGMTLGRRSTMLGLLTLSLLVCRPLSSGVLDSVPQVASRELPARRAD